MNKVSNSNEKISNLREQFWKKVKIKDKRDCWLWNGAIQSRGYGSFGIGNGKTALAHRVVYELVYGNIPEGYMVLHKCDNRRCVNPYHLFLGTHQDNMNDMVKKDRQAKAERNGRSKLSWNQVTKIRELHNQEKYSSKQIAKRFGVSPSNVRYILRGEYW